MSVPASISARFLSSLAQDFIEGNIRLRKNTCFDAFLSSLAQDFIEGWCRHCPSRCWRGIFLSSLAQDFIEGSANTPQNRRPVNS